MISVVRDANIRLGERVALFGLGAIGLMVLQMAIFSHINPGEEKTVAVKGKGMTIAALKNLEVTI